MADESLGDTIQHMFIFLLAALLAVTVISIFTQFASFVDITMIEKMSRDINILLMRAYASSEDVTFTYDPAIDEEASYDLYIASNAAGDARLDDSTLLKINETDRHGEEHMVEERMPNNFSENILVNGDPNGYKIEDFEVLEIERYVEEGPDGEKNIVIDVRKVS